MNSVKNNVTLEGSNELLKEGAKLVTNMQDILIDFA